MDSLLQRLKLIDYLITEFPIEKKVFIERLRKNVDQGDTGVFFSAFEAFSSSKNEYKGIVTSDSFKIRRRRKIFDMNLSLAVAEGNFRQKGDSLVIESKVKGFRGIFILFIAFLLMGYVVFIASFFSAEVPGNMEWFLVFFLFIHASIMLCIPYFMMRRGVSRMKYELERDLYYMTKQQPAITK